MPAAWRVRAKPKARAASSGYTLWNANLQYRPSENATVSLIGSNLTNKRYYQNQANRNVLAGNYLGEPRNITLKFNYKF